MKIIETVVGGDMSSYSTLDGDENEKKETFPFFVFFSRYSAHMDRIRHFIRP